MAFRGLRLLLVGVALLPAHAAIAQQYTLIIQSERVYFDPRAINTALMPSDSGWVLREALGINSAGQVVGDGTANGETHAFLLTAVRPTTSPR